MRVASHVLFLILAVLASHAAHPAGAAADPPVETVPIKPTKGQELSKADEDSVRAVLHDYLDALKHGDYVRAGRHIDPVSFLASVDTLARTIASSDAQMPAARRTIFGASTLDSLARRPVPETFRSYMQYQESANPEMRGILARAELTVLAARRMNDRVHVAYQITLPSEKPDAQPFTSVTAEQVRKVDGDWKIVFRIDR